ncbi:PTS sugar transporter subunit IIA [Oceanobacillus zhaokaii]|uniref:PTS sugar transporter subunit IIA n=1 Tax=Oceanobacillus zhaokaii TaxID=2052660 RepID=A0A345PEZ7_9BACI|nr:sucrose-specific PTS transporter subunit IIBC [Oceanobacillus zhaokaii]AXI08577.1 PTS sugar transporter subunit IIA [Oceanobacillus zhaokaii]
MSDNKNSRIVEELIAAIGGEDNISSVTHCATRLRFIVNDKEKIEKDQVENIDKVKGAFFNSGQYQVIFGTGTVNQMFEEAEKLGLNSMTKSEQSSKAAQSGSKFQRAIRTFGDVFVPIIPVLVATGLFMGVRGLLMQENILALFGMTPDDISQNFLLFTQVLTDTAFAFLPALVAWSAFRVFGGSPIIGLVLGLMLVSPALPNAYAVASQAAEPIMFFGLIPVVGYQGSVLPAFIAGFIGAKVERWVRKKTPDVLDLLVTPFVTLLVMITLSLFVIGPVFHSVEGLLLDAVVAVLGLPFGLSGIILGGLNQLIVVTGVHHVFNFLEIQLLEALGNNPYNAIVSCAVAAQGGATLAVALKTKSGKLKALAFPSSLSALLGITEPAIFGVNLRYFKPFLMGLVGGAVGGFLASIMELAGTGMAVTAIPGSLLYLNGQFFQYLFVNITAIAIAFVLTWFFGFTDKMLKEVKSPETK